MDVVLELKIERLQRWNSSTETFVILLSDHGSERRINWIPTHNLIQFFIKFPQLLPSKIFHCDECGADCLCVCRCIERPHEVKINSKCTHLPLVVSESIPQVDSVQVIGLGKRTYPMYSSDTSFNPSTDQTGCQLDEVHFWYKYIEFLDL
eukprot:TRINITY_DN1540_c0_g1_i13.p1 TRINITY_DN1540_c0_g1~~TRINITY_DN1540_c0_g1_i13.p1  ORF type:complete len:150 (-),score=22.59 TRINITY_DN1540_c0_g1_i13:249-698(-)